MQKRIITIEPGFTLTRITKKAARNVFENGGKVYIYPVYANPASPWFKGMPAIQKKYTEYDFDSYVNEFIFYNCNYSELGKYPAYYIQDHERN